MIELAWRNKAVRPYESLWILMQRFLWLNKPTKSDLLNTIEVPSKRISNLALISCQVIEKTVKQESLRRLLRLSDLQWRRATLDSSTVANHISTCMRFCPDCLTFAYHTALFQLLTVTNCPVHGCELIRGCSYCGQEIPSVLGAACLEAPFACPHCKQALAASAVIIDPPSIESVSKIIAIGNWYKWIAELPRVESCPLPHIAVATPAADTPILPLLEMVGRKPAPRAVNINRKLLEEGSLLVVCFGTRVNKGDEWESDLDREKRNALLYKAYRRNLQKRFPNMLRLMREYVRRLDNSLDIPDSQSACKAKTAAFALLLFRFTMENWNDLSSFYHRKSSTIIGASRGFEVPSELAGLRPRWSSSFRCSGPERRWLLDHLFLEAMRGLFAEAVFRADKMVRSGVYFLESLSPLESDRKPYSLGIFGRKARLEFWSFQVCTSPELTAYAKWG